MSKLAKAGTNAAVNAVDVGAALAISAIDAATEVGVNGVKELVAVGETLASGGVGAAAGSAKVVLAEVEEARSEILAAIKRYQTLVTGRLRKLLDEAADAIPIG